MQDTLNVRLLGPFSAEINRTPLTFRSDKIKALFVYLLLNPSPIARDRLAGMLWPDKSDTIARKNLRDAIFHLRKTLDEAAADFGTQHLKATRQTLHLAAPRQLDLEQLSDQNVHQLVRGEVMQGFYVSEAEPFGDWLLMLRETWHVRCVALLETQGKRLLAEQRYGEVERSALRLLALESWNERAHRQLMTSFAQQGRRTAALRQYERCVEILAQELGLEPSAKTQALAQQIADNRLTSPPPRIKRSLLPTPPTELIGRKQEIAAITDLLGSRRLVTLIGAPGAGKTHLALTVARQMEPTFADGASFVSLAELQDSADLPRYLVDQLAIPTDGQPPRNVLRQQLALQHRLLLFDNFEHLLEAAPFVSELLTAAPRLTVLATSRERLNLRGERLFPLAPLPIPPRDLPTEKSRHYSSVQLFVRRAGDLLPDITLDDDTFSASATICRALDGLPLAIELAAAQLLRFQTPQKLLSALVDPVQLLRDGARDLPPRQQALENTIAWSYRLLTPREQTLLRRLGILSADATFEALCAVCETDEAALTALVSKSLVRRRNDGRLTLLETIRAFARTQLQADPTACTAQAQRLIDYYAHWIASLGPLRVSAERDHWMQQMGIEEANVRRALQLSREVGDAENALLLSVWLGAFLRDRSHHADALQMLVETLEASADVRGSALRRLGLAQAGHIARHFDDYAASRRYYQLRLDDARYDNDQLEVIRSLACLGALTMFKANSTAELAAAEPYYEQALALAETLVITDADVRDELAMAAKYLRRYTVAEQLYQQNLRDGERDGNARIVAYSTHGLATVTHALGDYARASDYFARALAAAQVGYAPWLIASSQNGLGRSLYWLGRFAEAEEALHEALALCIRTDDLASQNGNLCDLGRVAMRQGRIDDARDLFQRSMVIAQQIDEQEAVANALLGLGWIAFEMGERAKATELLERALPIQAAVGEPVNHAETLRRLALATLDDPVRARAYWQSAEKLNIPLPTIDIDTFNPVLATLEAQTRSANASFAA